MASDSPEDKTSIINNEETAEPNNMELSSETTPIAKEKVSRKNWLDFMIIMDGWESLVSFSQEPVSMRQYIYHSDDIL